MNRGLTEQGHQAVRHGAVLAVTCLALATVVSAMASLNVALPDIAARVRQAFLDVYGRTPDAEETMQAAAFLDARADKPAEAARDLLWALMTSGEFLTMP